MRTLTGLVLFAVLCGCGCGEIAKILHHDGEDASEEMVGALVFSLPSPIAIVIKRVGKVGKVDLVAYPPDVEKTKQEVPFVALASPPEYQGGWFSTSMPITEWHDTPGILTRNGFSGVIAFNSQGTSVVITLRALENSVTWEVSFFE